MSNLHIAVVEDDADDREFISQALYNNSSSLKISAFSSGQEFMQQLESQKCVPDLILTDLRMPIMNGFEVIENVKQNIQTRNIPIVVLSTSGYEEDVTKATKLGAIAYFIKPFSLSEYTDITAKIISYFPFQDLSFNFSEKLIKLMVLVRTFLLKPVIQIR